MAADPREKPRRQVLTAAGKDCRLQRKRLERQHRQSKYPTDINLRLERHTHRPQPQTRQPQRRQDRRVIMCRLRRMFPRQSCPRYRPPSCRQRSPRVRLDITCRQDRKERLCSRLMVNRLDPMCPPTAGRRTDNYPLINQWGADRDSAHSQHRQRNSQSGHYSKIRLGEPLTNLKS